MKKRILALLLATTMICGLLTACGGKDKESNITNKDLVQKVRMHVECINYEDEELSYETTYEYTFYDKNLIETMTEKTLKNNGSDESIIRYVYEYDKHGNMIKCFTYDNDEKEPYDTETYTHEYDEKGNILKTTVVHKNGSSSVETLTYDTEERLSTRLFCIYDKDGNELSCSYLKYEYNKDGNYTKIYDELKIEGEVFIESRLYEYDEKGNIIQVSRYDENEQFIEIQETYSYSYNEKGEIDSYTTKSEWDSERTYEATYDAEGYCIKSLISEDGKLIKETKYTYKTIE